MAIAGPITSVRKDKCIAGTSWSRNSGWVWLSYNIICVLVQTIMCTSRSDFVPLLSKPFNTSTVFFGFNFEVTFSCFQSMSYFSVKFSVVERPWQNSLHHNPPPSDKPPGLLKFSLLLQGATFFKLASPVITFSHFCRLHVTTSLSDLGVMTQSITMKKDYSS